jgi:tetratricopeptide (TPR) repeat protein
VRVIKSGSSPWIENAKVTAGKPTKVSVQLQRELKSVAAANHDRREQIVKYLDAGNNYGAEVEYRAILQETPNDLEAHLGLAKALSEQGRYGEAIGEYEAALRFQPNNFKALVLLGKLYEIKRRDADAEAMFSRAAQVLPKDAGAQALLAWVSLRRGKLKQASRAIEQALAIKADPEFLDTKAYILMARGENDEALKLAQGNVQKSDDVSFKVVLAVLLYRLGQTDKALATYRELRQSSSDDEWGDLKRMVMIHGYSKSVLETLAKLITETN